MINAAPHYLLLAESQSFSNARNDGGRWRFVLEQIGGSEKLVVADSEPDVAGERLQLLTVIRALEALDQPSKVTLLTSSRYVTHGIRRGLPHWRDNNWQWERFGQMCSINDSDLWRRLDRALRLHEVDCRNWRLMSNPTPLAEDAQESSASMPNEPEQHELKLDGIPLTDQWQDDSSEDIAAEMETVGEDKQSAETDQTQNPAQIELEPTILKIFNGEDQHGEDQIESVEEQTESGPIDTGATEKIVPENRELATGWFQKINRAMQAIPTLLL